MDIKVRFYRFLQSFCFFIVEFQLVYVCGEISKFRKFLFKWSSGNNTCFYVGQIVSFFDLYSIGGCLEGVCFSSSYYFQIDVILVLFNKFYI